MNISERIQSMYDNVSDVYDTINNVDSPENKNIENIPDTIRKSYLDIMNNGYEKVWNNWDKVTGSGTEITLNNTEEAPMKIDYKGNTSQDTYTGKNLVDTQEQTITGLTMVKQDDGSLLVNGTISEIKFAQIVYMPDYTLSAGTYTLSCFDNTGQNYAGDFYIGSQYVYKNATNDKTLTIEAGTYNVRLQLYLPAKTYTNVKIYIQLENGSSKTSYEKYVGGKASPNPDYPQEIKVVKGDNKIKITGKNLFDKNNANVLNAYFSSSTITQEASNKTIYLKCLPNKTYTISKKAGQRFALGYSYVEPAYNGTIYGRIDNYTGTSITITTDANAEYLVIWGRNGNMSSEITQEELLNTLQVEVNSSATTYEPYTSEEHKISLSSKNLVNIGTQSFTTYKEYTGLNISAGTYTFSTKVISSDTSQTASRVYFYGANGGTEQTFININRNSRVNASFTTTFDIVRIVLYSSIDYASSNGKTATFENVQLEKGSSVTDYEEYFEPIELCKINTHQDKIIGNDGKNLLNTLDMTYIKSINTAGTWTGNVYAINGITYTFDDGGAIKANGTSTGNAGISLYGTSGNQKAINGKYILLGATASNISLRVLNYTNGYNYLGTNSSDTTPTELDLSTYNTGYIEIMIYSGQTISNVLLTPMLTDTQITEYQPYGSGEYYKKEMVGKVIYNGTENIIGYAPLNNDDTSWFQADAISDALNVLAITNNYLFSNYFSVYNCYDPSNIKDGMCYHTDKKTQFRISNDLLSDISTLANRVSSFKTWLSTHNTKVYYVLATPNYIKITNNTLIKQLDAIKKSKASQTNISQENDGLPFELDVSALME